MHICIHSISKVLKDVNTPNIVKEIYGFSIAKFTVTLYNFLN